MKKCFLLMCLLSLFSTISAQSLRESILSADLIVSGYTTLKEIETGTDYKDYKSSLKIDEVIKGNCNTDSVDISFSTFLYEVEEEPVSRLYFLKRDGSYYYITNICSKTLKQPVLEMLEINNVKEPTKRFSETIEWTLRILENQSPVEYCDYNDLDEYSAFYKFYKENGLISTGDSILNQKQKERVAKQLFEMPLWDRPECSFASMIYKDYPTQIEQYILKMLRTYFTNTEYINLYDVKSLLGALKKGRKGETIEHLLKKIDDSEDESIKKIIIDVTNEFEEILSSP